MRFKATRKWPIVHDTRRQFDKDMTGEMNETLLSYDVLGRLASLNIKMAEKHGKIQSTAVPLDTLPGCCTMTMHHEILVRGSLMQAGDGSALLSDTLSSARQ